MLFWERGTTVSSCEIQISFVWKKMPFNVGAMVHYRYCLPWRSNCSVITLVESYGGRQNLKLPGKPQMPNWKETAGHDHSGHCPLPSGIRWKWEDTVDGQTVSGPGLSTYHEQARKWVIYATDRHPTEIHLPFLTLENPANLWLTQTKQAIIEHIQRKPSEFWLGKMA